MLTFLYKQTDGLTSQMVGSKTNTKKLIFNLTSDLELQDSNEVDLSYYSSRWCHFCHDIILIILLCSSIIDNYEGDKLSSYSTVAKVAKFQFFPASLMLLN